MSVSINAICRKDRINQKPHHEHLPAFTVNRRSRYVSTGINIPADDWDFDTQTLKNPKSRRSATDLRANREIRQAHQTA